jgi:hypothetical protein
MMGTRAPVQPLPVSHHQVTPSTPISPGQSRRYQTSANDEDKVMAAFLAMVDSPTLTDSPPSSDPISRTRDNLSGYREPAFPPHIEATGRNLENK